MYALPMGTSATLDAQDKYGFEQCATETCMVYLLVNDQSLMLGALGVQCASLSLGYSCSI